MPTIQHLQDAIDCLKLDAAGMRARVDSGLGGGSGTIKQMVDRKDAVTVHVATIMAFENKFGGYSGAVRDESTRVVVRERFNTLDEARNWAKKYAWDTFGPVNYASMPRKGEYLANCWRLVK